MTDCKVRAPVATPPAPPAHPPIARRPPPPLAPPLTPFPSFLAPQVLIANTPMDTDKVKIYGSKIKVDSVAKVAEIENAEKEKMLAKVDRILAHGCNVFINRQLIYNLPEQRFADNGVVSIEHADFEGASASRSCWTAASSPPSTRPTRCASARAR